MDTSNMTEEQEKFNKFLEETKERFDQYFGELGYVCFMFNKVTNKGESVFITNCPENVLAVVEPYANAPKLAERKAKKSELKRLRRIK